VSATIPVFLKEVATSETVAAELVVGLTTDEVDEAVGLWSPYLRKRIQETGSMPDHAHWDWSLKARAIRGIQGYVVAGIRLGGEIQAMLLWDDIASRAKYPSQLGQELVYVHFLSTAPWNDHEISSTPKYRGAGTLLVAAAVAHSVEEEFKGRVGLHALPKAESFYRDRCSMIDLGLDASHQNLRYFEFTPELGKGLLEKTGVRL
jgi:hypothetical protein